MQKVDETINTLCDWIQRSLKNVNAVQEGKYPAGHGEGSGGAGVG